MTLRAARARFSPYAVFFDRLIFAAIFRLFSWRRSCLYFLRAASPRYAELRQL